MSIQQLNNHRISAAKVGQAEQVLKPGQIVKGQVSKLYPGNKAEIQIGSMKLTAQLKASLTIGERYHFQVQTEDDVIYLKVLGDKLVGQSETQNAAQLLKQIGLKANKQQMALLQSLMSDDIPFDSNQLKQAFKLLEANMKDPSASSLIKDMIASRIPLTQAVYDALNVSEKNMFSNQLNSLLESLVSKGKLTESERNLMQMIKQITERPLSSDKAIIKQINNELSTNRQSLFNALKIAGLIDENITYESWQSSWSKEGAQKLAVNKEAIIKQLGEFQARFANSINQAISSQTPLSSEAFNSLSQFITDKVLPLLPESQQAELKSLLNNQPESLAKLARFIQAMNTNMADLELPANQVENRQVPPNYQMLNNAMKNDADMMLQAFEKLNLNRDAITQQASDFRTQFLSKINQAIITQSPLSKEVFQELTQFVNEKVLPLLPESQQAQLKGMLKNDPDSLTKLITTMQSMQNSDAFDKVSTLLKENISAKEFLSQPVSRQFFAQVKNVIEMTGLNYENLLSTNNENQASQTIKSALLQMMQHSDLAAKEQPSQLLNVINHMQLQSVTESNNTLFAQLQIPGEKFGLSNDIDLKFEGGKKDGKVDVDFCRILFDLELGNFKKTLIDMNVQKRSVALTIYNDHDSNVLKQLANPLQSKLKEGLQSLEYQLSSVSFKALTERESKPTTVIKNDYASVEEGVDYRI